MSKIYEIIEPNNEKIFGMQDQLRALLNSLNNSCDGKLCVLLHGPPRTAKTTLAQEYGKKLKKSIVWIKCNKFLEESDPWNVFKELKECVKKCDIVVFDEIDFITPDRAVPELADAKTKGLLGLVMNFLDEFHESKKIIATTNAVHQMDDAVVTRTKLQLVARMSNEERIAMLEGKLPKVKLSKKEKSEFLKETEYYPSGELHRVLQAIKKVTKGKKIPMHSIKNLKDNMTLLDDKKMQKYRITPYESEHN